jgi:hypothetical protein
MQHVVSVRTQNYCCAESHLIRCRSLGSTSHFLALNDKEMMGIEADNQRMAEKTSEWLLLRPCVTLPIEIYSDERTEEFDEAEADLDAMLGIPGAA